MSLPKQEVLPVTIVDDDVALADLSDAYFVALENYVTTEELYSLTVDDFDYIGDGAVFYHEDIYNNASEVSNAIGQAPDLSSLHEDGIDIEWNYLVMYEESIYVVGTYTEYVAEDLVIVNGEDIPEEDISVNEDISNTESDIIEEVETFNAEYYLFNPRGYNASFTSVTPWLCKYVGAGSIFREETFYNSPDEVSSIIAEEPPYTAPAGKIIEWGTTYNLYGKNYVIGRYVDSSSTTDPAIAEPEIVPTPTEFATIDDLIKTDLSVDSTVHTNGFRSEGDGGGATYTIVNTVSSVDDMFTFRLDNGLFASLFVENDTLCVDQIGAYGDGENDDVAYIQKAINSGYNVTLGENKNYKLASNGLYFTSNKEFDGKNSHFIIDESYSPKNGDFSRFILRTKYGKELDTLTIRNLIIDVDIYEQRYSGSNYLCVLQPQYVKDITLENVIMNINCNTNDLNALWMNNGCDSLTITDCSFINNSEGIGGILFLNSRDDSTFHYYEDFKNVTITRTRLEGICTDEAIAIYGPNDVHATFEDCIIDWKRASKDNGTSRPIAIWCNKDSNTKYNVLFKGCDIVADSDYADACIGVGSVHPQDISVHFEDCNILANVKNCLLYFQLLAGNAGNVPEFDFEKDKFDISFDRCEIECNKTITGASKWYNGESGSVWAIDCAFNDCKIDCNYAFAYMERSAATKFYYVPQIEIDNCDINIDDAIGFIYKSNYTPEANLDISNTNVYADGVEDVTTYRYKSNNGSGETQANVDSPETTISNTYVNDELSRK